MGFCRGKIPGLPGLAYECESLVVRDPLLLPALVRDLLDVAIALREKADRRQRGGSGGEKV